jgi:transcriptional regulator with XRE-family HTH domain
MPPGVRDHFDAAPLWAWLVREQRSVRWLARRTGVSEGTIRAVKMGKRHATRAFAERIATGLGLPAGDLFLPIVHSESTISDSDGNT